MRIGKLSISGFFSYSTKKSVISLRKRGLLLVKGENRDDPTTQNNGAAKSAIVEALLWCLFGMTMRGQKGDEVVNRKAKGGVRVSVSFTDDTGERFRVTRYRKHPKHKNALVFEGKGVTANETSRTQEAIEEAIGFTYQTFVASVVFGQGAFKRFADMTDTEKKAVTDKLIGLEVFTQAHKEANAALKNLDAELAVLQEADLGEYEEAVEDAKRGKREWVGRHDAKLASLEDQLKGLTKKSVNVKELEEAVSETKKTLEEARSLVQTEREKLEAAREKRSNAEAKTRALRDALALVNGDEGECAHCGSTVSQSDLKAHRESIEVELRAAGDKAEGRRIEEAKLKSAVAEAEKPLREIEAELQRQRDKVAVAKTLLGQADVLKKTLEAERKEENPYQNQLEKAQAKLEKMTEKNARTAEQREAFTKQRKRLAFIVGMFSDKGTGDAPPLKGLLVDSVAPYLNKRLAYYSRKLTDGNIDVSFSTQAELKSGEKRDNYSLDVTNRYGADVYQGLSGGEKRKVDVIVFLALQDLAATRSKSRCALLCLDEVFDALDETAQEVMVEHLQEEAKRKETVLVITQRPELEGYFPNVVTVVKKGGISRFK